MFAAIKRTFQALDDEIIKEAMSCDIADCQFGGSTAVIALRIGHVSLQPSQITLPPAFQCRASAVVHCTCMPEMSGSSNASHAQSSAMIMLCTITIAMK